MIDIRNIALYAGSFDPFTLGHYEVLQQAQSVFNKVVVFVASNSNKQRRFSLERTLDALISLGVDPIVKDGLVAEYCKEHEIHFLVRGLRNTSDYLYEENIAKINNEIDTNLKTIYFRASNDVISSSMVWELHKHGVDVSKYLPYSVKYLEGCRR